MEAVCPLLALAGDGRTVVEGVDDAHRCHAEDPPLPLDRHLQARTCLTSAHVRCERYLAYGARHGPVRRVRSTVGQGLVSTRLTLAPEPAWRGLAGRAARGRRSGLAAAVVAGAVVTLGAGTAVAWALGGLPLVAGGPSPSPVASAAAFDTTPSASPSPSPTPSPTASPSATPRPSASPSATPAPTASPSPTPSPVRTYVVRQGDTLAALAERFGTTVAALQDANGIEDPNEIVIGQVLVIP